MNMTNLVSKSWTSCTLKGASFITPQMYKLPEGDLCPTRPTSNSCSLLTHHYFVIELLKKYNMNKPKLITDANLSISIFSLCINGYSTIQLYTFFSKRQATMVSLIVSQLEAFTQKFTFTFNSHASF